MSRLHPDTHPDFLDLLGRYEKDRRFLCAEEDRKKCIDYLLELNDWVQSAKKLPEILAVLLAGSFSSLKAETPDLRPVVDGPWYRGRREGGSDIDVLFFYKTNIAGLLKLKWLDFNLPERELVHPDDFIVNTIRSLCDQLKNNCSPELGNRVEIHVAALTQTLGKFALKKYARGMIQTGTLIWGSLPINDYGKYRENPPTFKRNTSDAILDQMSGGF
ncbi:hypothetical protein A2572_04165 [Candidatus Collierbacteria bacterium RIFOXYD1_FULL_40_9]|uniref:Uncharacterized protein n=1 Tax=Candidatus Collierbacteria bacterium RIFOXYD1_FULL_40_9 TaxID=1817731 RepID=A0A1F5FPL6_9BACT|nr:MAG: hypothetical protein A2572_04165 [Candidatus Collierbacteria bacterium RIFOXYD1_FULL_40_9]